MFNSETSEICRQANQMKYITQNLVKKLKIYELQACKAISTKDEDSDFGLLIDPALYVKYDDKVKFAELLKSCTRDQLTQVI